MKLLALSTSTSRGSAALLQDTAPGGGPPAVTASAYADLQGHAERIFEAIDAVLSEAGLPRSAIDAIACDVGPGSFTGVRVGVASAKGIALALGVPLVGAGSLEAMAAAAFAEGVAGPGDVVVPAIDAKKGEIFLAAYDASLRAIAEPCYRPAAADAVASLALATAPIVVGEIAAELLGATRRSPAIDLPDAAWIARLGRARLEAGGPTDAADLEPLYVRPPDAKPMPSR